MKVSPSDRFPENTYTHNISKHTRTPCLPHRLQHQHSSLRRSQESPSSPDRRATSTPEQTQLLRFRVVRSEHDVRLGKGRTHDAFFFFLNYIVKKKLKSGLYYNESIAF